MLSVENTGEFGKRIVYSLKFSLPMFYKSVIWSVDLTLSILTWLQLVIIILNYPTLPDRDGPMSDKVSTKAVELAYGEVE